MTIKHMESTSLLSQQTARRNVDAISVMVLLFQIANLCAKMKKILNVTNFLKRLKNIRHL